MDNLTDKQWEAIIKKAGCAFKPLHIIRGDYANTSMALRLYISLLAKKEVFDDIDIFVKKFDFWMAGSRIEIEYNKVKKRYLPISPKDNPTLSNGQMMAQLLKQEIYCESGKLKHLINDKKVEKFIKEITGNKQNE